MLTPPNHVDVGGPSQGQSARLMRLLQGSVLQGPQPPSREQQQQALTADAVEAVLHLASTASQEASSVVLSLLEPVFTPQSTSAAPGGSVRSDAALHQAASVGFFTLLADQAAEGLGWGPSQLDPGACTGVPMS